MDFNNLKTTKRGYAGEVYGKKFIIEKGYMPYAPAKTGSHPIDYIAMSGASIWNLDVKTKDSLTYYPVIGVDKSDVIKYSGYAFPTYLLFVDTRLSQVYGQWLSNIVKEEKMEIKGKDGKEDVWCYPISAMTFHYSISNEELTELNKYKQTKY